MVAAPRASSRNVLAIADAPVGQALYAAAARGGAQAQAWLPVRSRRVAARISSCSTPRIPRSPAADRHDARRGDIRPVPQPVRDVMVGGRWVSATAITPTSPRCWPLSKTMAALAAMTRSTQPMFDALITGAHLATMAGAATIRTGRFATARSGSGTDDRVDRRRARPAARRFAQRLLHVPGAWATPGLVDCHTHLVYAGNPGDEFEARQRGATYAEIAQRGRRHQRDRARDARGE
jgi:hypothetical protein